MEQPPTYYSNTHRRFSRRRFLELSALGAAATLLPIPGCQPVEPTYNIPGIPPTHSQAIVIGSGFGGAVAALRLGQAGIQTTVLERGKRWAVTPSGNTFCSSFSPDQRSTWLRNQTIMPVGLATNINVYTGVLERVDFPNMKIYAGAGVGGGSLVYGGMTVQPPKTLFEQVFAPTDPNTGTNLYDELNAVYYPRVMNMLNAQICPENIRNTNHFYYAQVFGNQASQAGYTTELIPQAYDWSIIQQEINGTLPESSIKGELIYGDNNGGKNSLDRNYIPAAEATGNVRVYEFQRVKHIHYNTDGTYSVEIERINEQGVVQTTYTLTADSVFVCAGSVGTTRLLMHSKAQGHLPDINDQIGQNWGSNGNSMFRRNLLNAVTSGGPSLLTSEAHACPPIRALRDSNNPIAPVLIESAPYPITTVFPGTDCYCLLQLGLALSDSRGHFTYNAATQNVELVWSSNGNNQAIQAIQHVVNNINSNGSGYVDATAFANNGYSKDFTYHPLGGAVMGQACDFYGRVSGYQNLYVLDGSLIPGSAAAANPSLTIAAIAERNIEKIIAQDF